MPCVRRCPRKKRSSAVLDGRPAGKRDARQSSAAVDCVLERLPYGEFERLRRRDPDLRTGRRIAAQRAARAPVESDPNLIRCTVPPCMTAPLTVAIGASSASAVSTMVEPVFAATLSISSCLIMVTRQGSGPSRSRNKTPTQNRPACCQATRVEPRATRQTGSLAPQLG